jgi:3-oxoacyl-[acyl-carrier-protein] synthase-3
VSGEHVDATDDRDAAAGASGTVGREVAITGYGVDVPDEVVSGSEIADASGIPEDVVVEKMGVREKRVAGDDDHVTDMSVRAGRRALADAGLGATDLDLVLFHGSEFKDHVVWSAAANVAERLGADEAYAHESYALCAGAPIALRHTAAQLRVGDVDRALLVTASREEELVDYGNEDASFMFNFGSGGSALVLEAVPASPVDAQGPTATVTERSRGRVRESAAVTDGSFSLDVVMPAGGSKRPPSHGTVEAGEHTLDVPDPEDMKRRLADVSAPAFLSVADEALAKSGYDRADLDFVALTHMKRSFHEYLLSELGLGESGGYYLDEFGHVQSADQTLALDRALSLGRVEAGDLVLFLAAGTGYTWAATVIEWRG